MPNSGHSVEHKVKSSTDTGINGTNEDYDSETITIVKAGGPLGLSIVGGTDHTSHPFGLDEPGIFISKVGFSALYFPYRFLLKLCN